LAKHWLNIIGIINCIFVVLQNEDFQFGLSVCNELIEHGHSAAWDVCVDLAEHSHFQNVHAK